MTKKIAYCAALFMAASLLMSTAHAQTTGAGPTIPPKGAGVETLSEGAVGGTVSSQYNWSQSLATSNGMSFTWANTTNGPASGSQTSQSGFTQTNGQQAAGNFAVLDSAFGFGRY